MTLYNFEIYGLVVQSAVNLPTWNAVNNPIKVDAVIELKKIDDRYLKRKKNTTVKPFSHLSPTHFFLDVAGVAKYLVKKNKILIERYPNSLVKEVILFLEETPLTILMQMNNIFLFEASALVTSKGVTLICGKTNSGKSTLTAGLLNKQNKFIADDKCLVFWNEKTKSFHAKAYIKRMHLWKTKNSKYKKEMMHAPVQIRKNLNKHSLKIKGLYVGKENKVNRLILIKIANSDLQSPTHKEIKGVLKINALKNHTHLFYLTALLGRDKEHFSFISQVAQQSSIFTFTRNRLTTFKETLKFFKDENLLS